MRMSCNGCRVLRKGCSDNCSIRPCLLWITSPDSQAHATLFLAKFYGRAGLINLLNSGPDHLRPAIFRSLLYEACGRIVNPIHGSAGLLWSGNWQLCQDAVDAALRGSPLATIACSSDDDAATTVTAPPVKAYDIRHVTKDEFHRVKTRPGRFKRSAAKTTTTTTATTPTTPLFKPKALRAAAPEAKRAYRCGSSSHESSMSHETIDDSLVSSDTAEALTETTAVLEDVDGEVELELTLGIPPVAKNNCGGGRRPCKMEIGV